MLNNNYMNGKPRQNDKGKPQPPNFEPGSFANFRRPGKRPGQAFTEEEHEEISRRFGQGRTDLDEKLKRWAHFH